MIRTLSLAVALAFSVVVAAPAFAQNDQFFGGAPEVPGFEPAFEGQFRATPIENSVAIETETVADGLEHPWGIDQLPDGRFLVTERPGRLRIVAADGTVSDPIAGVPEVVAQRQGGLLDVTLAPDFAQTREVFRQRQLRREDQARRIDAAGLRLAPDILTARILRLEQPKHAARHPVQDPHPHVEDVRQDLGAAVETAEHKRVVRQPACGSRRYLQLTGSCAARERRGAAVRRVERRRVV